MKARVNLFPIPMQLADFTDFLAAARAQPEPQGLLFVAALAAERNTTRGAAPQPASIERGLRMMVDAVQRGAVERFLAFDPRGDAVRFA